MCGRYVLSVDPGGLQQAFDLEGMPSFAPKFNVAPTQFNPVISNQAPRQAVLMRWGLIPPWAKDMKLAATMINARAESVAEKPSFRAAYKARRCLVPVTGYYEWPETDASKTPMYISLPQEPIFAVAGIWEQWRQPETGEIVRSYSMITTDANEFTRQFHHRMPVILRREHYADWLSEGDASPALAALLKPLEGVPMAAHLVTKAVNKPINDSPDLIEPVA